MIEYPPIEAVQIPLSEQQLEELSKNLQEKIRKSRTSRKKIEDRWSWNQAQYDGELRRMDSPDEWEPDVDAQTTFIRCQARQARLINPIVQQDPIFIAVPFEGYEDFAETIEHYLKFKIQQMESSGNNSFRRFLERIVVDLDVYGLAIVKVPFVIEKKRIREWKSFPASTFTMPQQQGNVHAITQAAALIEREVVTKEGAFPEVIHPLDFFWFPFGVRSVEQAELIAERKILQKHEIETLVRSGVFQQDAIEKLKNARGVELTDVEKERLSEIGVESESVTGYEVYEIYHRIEDESGQLTDAITVLELSTGQILRHVYNFFSDYRIPYFVLSSEPESMFLFGRSLAERMRDLHLVANASLNIELENGAMGAKAFYITDDDAAGQLEGRKIRPLEVIRGTRPANEAIRELDLSGRITPLTSTRAWVEQRCDMLSATSLPMFGIEPVERPTASGTVREIEEAQQPLFRQLDALRNFLSRIFMCVLARDRQFFPMGLEFFVQTEAGERLRRMFLSFPDGLLEKQIIVVPKASSQDLSLSSKREGAVAALEQIKATYGVILQFLGAAATPSPIATVAVKLASSINKQLFTMLDYFDLPNMKDLYVDIETEVQDAGRLMETIQQLQQQLEAISSQQTQPPWPTQSEPTSAGGTVEEGQGSIEFPVGMDLLGT